MGRYIPLRYSCVLLLILPKYPNLKIRTMGLTYCHNSQIQSPLTRGWEFLVAGAPGTSILNTESSQSKNCLGVYLSDLSGQQSG